MVKSGIIDSFGTIRTALQDAVSVASLILTTEVLIYKEISYEPPPLDYYKNQYMSNVKARIDAKEKFESMDSEGMEDLKQFTQMI